MRALHLNLIHNVSLCRCAEPIRLRSRKLKQVDPELLCQEFDPSSITQGDQTDPSDAALPIPFRSKPEATTSCHTYRFPQVRMDCSSRGKLHCSSTLWFPLDPSGPRHPALNPTVLSDTQHVFPMRRRGRGKYPSFYD